MQHLLRLVTDQVLRINSGGYLLIEFQEIFSEVIADRDLGSIFQSQLPINFLAIFLEVNH